MGLVDYWHEKSQKMKVKGISAQKLVWVEIQQNGGHEVSIDICCQPWKVEGWTNNWLVDGGELIREAIF